MFVQSLKRHFDHAHRTVYDHLPCVDDGGCLLSLQHDRGDLGRVGEIGDPCLDDLDTCFLYPVLDLVADPGGYDLAGTAQAAFVCDAVPGSVHTLSHVVRIDADDIAQGAVALQGKEFLVVIHVKYGFGGVDDAPCHGDADFHRVAQTVVDLLAAVVQGHDLQGNLLAGCFLCSGCRCACTVYIVDIPALAELRMGSGIDAGTERIDKVEAILFERSDIVAEQRQHQRFLRSQYLESAEKDPAEGDDQHT